MKVVVSAVLVLLIVTLSQASNSATTLKLADKFYSDSLHSMALTQYEQYVNGSPDPEQLPKVFFRLGLILKGNGQDAEALDWFDRLIRRFPSDPHVKNARFLSAEIYRARKQWFEAAEEFYLVWQVFGMSAEAEDALFFAGECYTEGGDVARAVELYQRFLVRYSSSSRNGEVAANVVKLQILQENYSDALNSIETYQKIKMKPDWSAELRYLKALSEQVVKGDSAAETILAKLLTEKTTFESQAKAVVLYADILVKNKAYTKAWELYKTFRNDNTDIKNLEEIMFWADVAFRVNSFDDCELLYKKALGDSSVDSSLVSYLSARNYDAAGDFYSALNALRFVTQSDSLELAQNGQLKIAELYYKYGIFTNAVQEYRAYLAQNGNRSDMVLYRIGRIYQEKLSAPEMALREYEKLQKWYGGSEYVGRAAMAMAEIYEQREEFDDAYQMYRYIHTLESYSDLGKHAFARSEYLQRFKIPHTVKAVSALTELSLSDSLTSEEKRIEGAEIYSSYLKDRYRSVELLEPLLKDESADSLTGVILMRLAVNWKELSEQFKYEKNEDQSTYALTQSKNYYSRILENEQFAPWHDEARFALVVLSGEGVSLYETFVAENQSSSFRGDAYLKIAEIYSKSNSQDQLVKAADAYRNAFTFGSDSIRTSALIGALSVTLDLGEIEKSEELIQQFKNEFSDQLKSEIFSWMQARLYQLKKEYENAGKLYSYIIATFPQGGYAAQSRLQLASVEAAQNKYAQAFNNYNLAASLFPTSSLKAEAHVGEIATLVLQGRSSEALQKYGDIGAPEWFSNEQKSAVQYWHAKALELEGESYTALKEYAGALANNEFSMKSSALRAAASLSFAIEDYEKARSYYNELTDLNKDSLFYEMRYLSSSILAGKGESVAERYKEFKKVSAKGGEDKLLEVYYSEGLYYYKQEEYDKAEKRFQYIVKKSVRSPRADDAQYYRGLILYNQKKYDDALELMQSFTTAYPESELYPSALFTIAMIYHRTEKMAEAAKQYELSAESAGTDKELRFRSLVNGAVIWQKLSAWESAAKMSELVMNEFPDRIDLSSYALKTGFAYLKGNRVKRALDYFEMAQENPSKDDVPEITYWIAQSNLRLGREEIALELFLKISYLYGDSGKWGVTADFESARIYEQRGEFPKAISLYKKIVRIEGENSPLGGNAQKRIDALETLMEEL